MNTQETIPGTTPAPQSAQTPGRTKNINLERFKNCVLFSISLSVWGNSMRVRDMAAIDAFNQLLKVENDEDAAAGIDAPAKPAATFVASDRLKSSKTLLRSNNLAALKRAMGELKRRVEASSMPSYFRAGMFVVRQEQVTAVEQVLKDGWKSIQENQLKTFVDGYEADIAAAKTARVKLGGLGPLFNENDYPSKADVQNLFGMDWLWLTLSVPENIPEALRDEANEKFKRKMEDAADEITQALRGELLELISHAEERLTTTAGSAPKVFRDSMVGNIRQFLNTFQNRDLFGDAELAKVVEQARAVLVDANGGDKINAAKLRDFASVREEARKQFAAIKENLSGLVEEKGRKIDLTED